MYNADVYFPRRPDDTTPKSKVEFVRCCVTLLCNISTIYRSQYRTIYTPWLHCILYRTSTILCRQKPNQHSCATLRNALHIFCCLVFVCLRACVRNLPRLRRRRHEDAGHGPPMSVPSPPPPPGYCRSVSGGEHTAGELLFATREHETHARASTRSRVEFQMREQSDDIGDNDKPAERRRRRLVFFLFCMGIYALCVVALVARDGFAERWHAGVQGKIFTRLSSDGSVRIYIFYAGLL